MRWDDNDIAIDWVLYDWAKVSMLASLAVDCDGVSVASATGHRSFAQSLMFRILNNDALSTTQLI